MKAAIFRFLKESVLTDFSSLDNGQSDCINLDTLYKITCSLCQKAYIGETCRPFHTRLDKHRRSIAKRDQKSALADHIRLEHGNQSITLHDFSFDIIAKFSNPIETRIGEARMINVLRPELNRRHERAGW